VEYCVLPQDYRILEKSLVHNSIENLNPECSFNTLPDLKDDSKTRKRTAETDLVIDSEETKKKEKNATQKTKSVPPYNFL